MAAKSREGLSIQCFNLLHLHNSHQTAEVVEVVNEQEELRDVICDRGAVGMQLAEVFLINLANS